MKSKIQIVVQGTKLIADYLKKNLTIPNSVYFSQTQDDIYFKKVKNAHVLVTMSWGKNMFGEKGVLKIPETKNLKLLHMPGAGTDGVNFQKVPIQCKVCNVYEHETTIAEYCVANMLNWEIKLLEKANKFKKHDWSDSLFAGGIPHSELNYKNVGIIGYGRIGKELAKKLKAFNTKTFAFTRVLRKKDKFIEKSIVIKYLDKYLKKLDYIVLCCPLNKSTMGLINKNNLKIMNRSCVIINIARGDVIVEKDFYNALKNKTIGGGIIDTWYRYPINKDKKSFNPSRYNFNKLNNVIMTPHISAWSKSMIIRRSNFILKNVLNLYYGKRLKNIVKKINNL